MYVRDREHGLEFINTYGGPFLHGALGGALGTYNQSLPATVYLVNWTDTQFKILSAVDSSDTSGSTGSLCTLGGISAAKNVYVGARLDVTGVANFRDTTDSTSATTGSVILNGGLGVGKNLNIPNGYGVYITDRNHGMEYAAGADGPFLHGNLGGYLGVYQALGPTTVYTAQWSATQLRVLPATASTSYTTGSLTSAGGIGSAGNLHVQSGSGVYVRDREHGLEYDGAYGGPFLHGALGGALGTYNQSLPATTYTLEWSATQVEVLSTLDATSASGSSGSLATLGGVSIAKDLWVGGTIHGSITGNAAALQGKTWEVPGTIGSTTPNTGAFTTLTASGSSTLTSTTDSSSSVTGALVVAGGVGVAKRLYVGTNFSAAGDSTLTSATDSSSFSTGALVVSGGLGVGKNLQVQTGYGVYVRDANQGMEWSGLLGPGQDGPFLHGFNGGYLGSTGSGSPVYTLNWTDTSLKVLPATDALSTSTGALVLSGGIGVAKQAWIGTNLTVGANSSFLSTVDAISSTNGSVVFAGGVGIAKKLFVGTNFSAAGDSTFTSTTSTTAYTNGSVVLSGGVGIAGDVQVQSGKGVYIRDQFHGMRWDNNQVDGPFVFGAAGGKLGRINPSGSVVTYTTQWDDTQFRVLASTDSTSGTGTNGSLCTAGGASIAKKLYVGSTTNATSTTTGAAVVSGGAGIASDLWVGGSSYLGSSSPFTYLHGSWTPTMVGETVGGLPILSAISYTSQVGFYTVAGRTVTVNFDVSGSYSTLVTLGTARLSYAYLDLGSLPGSLAPTTTPVFSRYLCFFNSTIGGLDYPFVEPFYGEYPNYNPAQISGDGSVSSTWMALYSSAQYDAITRYRIFYSAPEPASRTFKITGTFSYLRS